VEFPFRLFTNCGQDSIARPVMGKHGIPWLPGSSVKGLFRRACGDNREQINQYCGDKANLTPGTTGLRFHGAYPLDNWGERIRDVVHPQENRQVGGPEKKHESAHPLISLYRPTLVFEFSAPPSSAVDWQEVEQILRRALALGVGGKTSVSYGTSAYFSGAKATAPNVGASHRQFRFTGDALSPKLLTQESEFRPNLFKATLRSHARRLLAGALGPQKPMKPGGIPTDPMEAEVNRLFGHTNAPGVVQVVWQPKQLPDDRSNHTIYHAEGVLHVGIEAKHPNKREDDMAFVMQLLRFAYLMGGFGKSWRRVWHDTFYPSYFNAGHAQKFPIGCHWVSPDVEAVADRAELATFLSKLHQTCCKLSGFRGSHPAPWRESWHPQRVAVYCRPNPDKDETVIRLFHDDIFKTTPAIGGKRPGDQRPTGVSSVWHRMVPIAESHLEIVTVFHGDRTPWQRKREDQLLPFIRDLEAASLDLTWGTRPQ
jgi:CRISPR-associated protein Cmr6